MRGGSVALLSIVAVAACSPRGTARVDRAAAGGGGTPAQTRDAEALSEPTAVSGAALENGRALTHVFDALSGLESGAAKKRVRIVQFGDSHTAADLETGVVRRLLQARFGNGGRGYVSLGRPWKSYGQQDVRVGATRDFFAEHGRLTLGRFEGDGLYGLVGVASLARRAGASAWTEVLQPVSRVEVGYLEGPTQGSFELFVDGQRVGRLNARSREVRGSHAAFDVVEGPHRFEVRAAGDGEVRIFGGSLERASPGLILDAFGQNGARATTLLQWDENHFASELKHLDPDLVILAFGTNEAADEAGFAVYESRYVDVLGRISRAVPRASCLILGPPDHAVHSNDGWLPAYGLVSIISMQRRLAAAAGCAFFDRLSAMGGLGSMGAWSFAEPALAQADHVHFTREGYARLGERFVSELLFFYDRHKAGTGTVAGGASTPKAVAPSFHVEPF